MVGVRCARARAALSIQADDFSNILTVVAWLHKEDELPKQDELPRTARSSAGDSQRVFESPTAGPLSPWERARVRVVNRPHCPHGRQRFPQPADHRHHYGVSMAVALVNGTYPDPADSTFLEPTSGSVNFYACHDPVTAPTSCTSFAVSQIFQGVDISLLPTLAAMRARM